MDALLREAKIDDLRVIMDVLQERSRTHAEPINLTNARLVLFVGLRNKPQAWTVSFDEFSALWAEVYPEFSKECEAVKLAA